MADVFGPLGDSVEDVIAKLKSEEGKDKDAEEESVESSADAVEEEELSEEEEYAASLGWKKEGIEGKRYKSAAEFLEFREVLDKVSSQNKKINNLKNTLEKYKEAMQKSTKAVFEIREQAYNEAVQALKKEKRQLERNQQFDEADAIEDQINKYDAELSKVKKDKEEAVIDDEDEDKVDISKRQQEFKDYWIDWQESNEWVSDRRLEAAFVKMLEEEVIAEPEIEPALAFRRAKAAVKLKYPGKIGGKSKSPTGSNRSGTDKMSRSDSQKLSNFDSEQQEVIRQMADASGMTVAEYLKMIS